MEAGAIEEGVTVESSIKRFSASTKPFVFLIGDSISIDYGETLSLIMEGDLKLARKTGYDIACQNLDVPRGANAGNSDQVLAYLKELEASSSFSADLLLINCGLHDIKRDKKTSLIAVEQEEYRDNLRKIVAVARTLAGDMAWITTTPCDDEMHAKRKVDFVRQDADVVAYNSVSTDVMRELGVATIELGDFTRKLGKGASVFRDGVHFVKNVQSMQAAYIGGWLSKWLER